MAITIPPWLNLDPIEPARIAERTSTRRAANVAAERRAQLEEQRIFAQQQMMYARIAAQERADMRKEQVLRETQDARLAQQAAALEFRRQMAAQQNQRDLQRIRIRERQVEQQASSASRKLFGMRNLQEALKQGVPLEKALQENAADLFADRPERMTGAIKAAQVPGAPIPFTAPGGAQGVYNPRTGTPSFPPRLPSELGAEAFQARDIMDPSGQPTGIRAIPGRGSARVLPGQRNVTPELQFRSLVERLKIAQSKSLLGRTKEERDAAALQRNKLEKELEQFSTSGAPPQERLPGKEDERVDEEEDFLLPPTGDEEEETVVDDGGAVEEEAIAEEDLEPEDEEELALEEDF